MSLKLATAVLGLAAVAPAPALACMGPTVLLSEDFQQADPAWQHSPDSTMSISGGYLRLSPPEGHGTDAIYNGAFFDNADACTDILSPTVTDPGGGAAGLVFGATPSGYHAVQITEDGRAALARWWFTDQACKCHYRGYMAIHQHQSYQCCELKGL